MGGGWKWLRIVSNCHGISIVKRKGSASRVFNGKEGTGRNRIWVSCTESTSTLCPWAWKNMMPGCLRQPARRVVVLSFVLNHRRQFDGVYEKCNKLKRKCSCAVLPKNTSWEKWHQKFCKKCSCVNKCLVKTVYRTVEKFQMTGRVLDKEL
jgi:hypothetical protein